jgi:hypothetical protein
MPNTIILPADLDQAKERIQSTLYAQGGIPEGFDPDQWLQDWIQRPQPALGGSRPVDLLGTQEGIETVGRVLSSVMSGAYQ